MPVREIAYTNPRECLATAAQPLIGAGGSSQKHRREFVRLHRAQIIAGFFHWKIGHQRSIYASFSRCDAELLQPKLQNGIQVREDDKAGIGLPRICFATSSTPAKLVPCCSARSLARWMTGPSATGSLNGTPSSITSAPASIAASATSREVSRLGIAAGDIGHQAGPLFESDCHRFARGAALAVPYNSFILVIPNRL